jgi:transcription antitermination factor NusA-like protein
LLEYIEKPVKVSRDVIGEVIGRSGYNIQDVMNKSGVLHVRVVDDCPEPPV